MNKEISAYWNLKEPEEYEAETSTRSKETRKYQFRSLDEIFTVTVFFLIIFLIKKI